MRGAANSQADSLMQRCIKITEQQRPEGKRGFPALPSTCSPTELSLQNCVTISAHFSSPKDNGKIHNSLQQNLTSCITAATASERQTRILTLFWEPSEPSLALAHAYFVHVISAEGGFLTRTPQGCQCLWIIANWFNVRGWKEANLSQGKFWMWRTLKSLGKGSECNGNTSSENKTRTLETEQVKEKDRQSETQKRDRLRICK